MSSQSTLSFLTLAPFVQFEQSGAEAEEFLKWHCFSFLNCGVQDKPFREVMALVDSEAAFEQRLKEVIPTAAVRGAIVNSGIRAFSGLAFASGTPQNPPTDDTFRAFADGILPAGYDMATYSSFRRLHFEASTLVVAQLKSKVTVDPDEGRQKLPIVEKQARLEEQRRRLTESRLMVSCNHLVNSWMLPTT